MKISKTFSRYMAKTYIWHLIILLAGLMGLIYFFDVIELLRRASKFDDVPLNLVFQMGFLKLPEVSQLLFPFAVLFSAIFTFWHLTQKLELIVVRAAGFSVWQFLLPIMVIAVFAGFLQMSVLNPLGAVFLGHYERLENVHLKRQKSEIAFLQDGLWLRQDYFDGYAILHMRDIKQPQWVFENVSGFFYDLDNNFLQRIDAEKSVLNNGAWDFQNVTIHAADGEKSFIEHFPLKTPLTIEDVEESFSSPETIAFWSLPGHIRILEESGFDASKLRVHYHYLLSQPLMLAAMVLLAAAVSMRPPRSGTALHYIAAGIFIGLLLFFLSNFMRALGASQQIPVVVAAWAPAALSFMFGLSIIINQEEG
jgi:lipopolysaccharide export system permease protein